MKKFRMLIVFTAVLGVLMLMSAVAYADDIKVTYNDDELTFDQPPIIQNGRTLVPLRVIFEALGAKVTWEGKTQTVLANWETDSLRLKIGEKVIHMGNGHDVAIDVPGQVLNGRTLVPLRAVSECMGADVTWNGEEKVVDIIKYWDTFYVDNVDEFVDHIASDTKIILKPGKYNLTEFINEKLDDVNFRPDGLGKYKENVYFEYVVEGYQLNIKNANMLMIEGRADSEGMMPLIEVESKSADVLTFDDCNTVKMKNLVLGHDVEPGYCDGNVIAFKQCNDAYLEKLDIYGCGAYGFEMINSQYINVDNCDIHDCTYGAMTVNASGELNFFNTRFNNCGQYAWLEFFNSNANFESCVFGPMAGEFIAYSDEYMDPEDKYDDSYENVRIWFSNCSFNGETRHALESNEYYGSRIQCAVG